MFPISVQIITHDDHTKREIRQEYMVHARFPRWEMLKIFFHALIHTKFH